MASSSYNVLKSNACLAKLVEMGYKASVDFKAIQQSGATNMAEVLQLLEENASPNAAVFVPSESCRSNVVNSAVAADAAIPNGEVDSGRNASAEAAAALEKECNDRWAIHMYDGELPPETDPQAYLKALGSGHRTLRRQFP